MVPMIEPTACPPSDGRGVDDRRRAGPSLRRFERRRDTGNARAEDADVRGQRLRIRSLRTTDCSRSGRRRHTFYVSRSGKS